MCFSRKTRDTNPQKLHDVEHIDSHENSDQDDLFIGEIDALNKPPENELFVALKVNGEDIRFKIDTGAQCNIIPEHRFAKLTHDKASTPQNQHEINSLRRNMSASKRKISDDN